MLFQISPFFVPLLEPFLGSSVFAVPLIGIWFSKTILFKNAWLYVLVQIHSQNILAHVSSAHQKKKVAIPNKY